MLMHERGLPAGSRTNRPSPIDTAGADSSPADERVRDDLIRYFFVFPNSFWVSNLIPPALIVAATYGTVPWTWWLPWALAQSAVLAWRVAVRRGYARAGPLSARQLGPWMRRVAIGVLASGATWGLASATFLLPDAQPAHWLLSLTLLGLVSGASVTMAANLPLFYAYVGLLMGPYLLGVLLQPDEAVFLAGLMVLGFTATRIIGTRQYRQRLAEMSRLREANVEMIEALRTEGAQAEAARERAEQSNQARSRYLAAASHGLRQPVHALGLFVDELCQQPATAPTPPALVASIGESIDSIDALLGAVLDVSKLDAGMVNPARASLRVDEVLAQVADQYRADAHAKGLALRHVPSSAWVYTDPVLLARIIGKLAANAVRYTARGRVVIGCRRLASGLRIEVWDTGEGIPASDHAVIFREFHRIDGLKQDGGLGLGLPIAQRTAALLGHPLTMRSMPGRGSVFRLEVPYGVKAAPRATLDPVAEQLDLRGFVVAVIDDEPAILAAMGGLLRRWGCEVITAGSGDDLLAACARQALQPDAMLVDYQLADGEVGVQVIARMEQALGRKVPCRLITGQLMREQIDQLEATGLHVLHKPVRPAQMRQCLTHLLRQATRRSA